MKKPIYPWHAAILNVQSTTRTRFAVPVQLRTSDGYRHVEARLPWGVTVKGLEENDFLTPTGTPFRYSTLTDEARAIRDKREKAAKRRRKARR